MVKSSGGSFLLNGPRLSKYGTDQAQRKNSNGVAHARGCGQRKNVPDTSKYRSHPLYQQAVSNSSISSTIYSLLYMDQYTFLKQLLQYVINVNVSEFHLTMLLEKLDLPKVLRPWP